MMRVDNKWHRGIGGGRFRYATWRGLEVKVVELVCGATLLEAVVDGMPVACVRTYDSPIEAAP